MTSPTTTDRADRAEGVLPLIVERHVAAGRGDRPFIGAVGSAWRTFADIDRAGRVWTTRLRDLGVAAGDRVAVLVPVRPEAIELWCGIGRAGAIEVPVHNELRGSMLAHVLNDCGARVLVADVELADRLELALADCRHLETIVTLGAAPSWLPGAFSGTVIDGAELSTEAADIECTARCWDTSSILYTSGTTGPAKGAMLPWGQFNDSLATLFPDVTADDCFYSPLPLHHIAARSMVYTAARRGGRVALRARFARESFWSDVRQVGATATILMGAMADMLWREPARPDDRDHPLRTVLMTPLLPQLEQFVERFGVDVRTNFGMTEVGAPIVGGVQGPLVDLVSCGTAQPGFICRVVDSHDVEVPHGEVGELVIRTDEPWMLTSGYWNAPDKTIAAQRNQWFHTGDAFRRDEAGNFYFVDRVKDTIRRGGENVSSFHLEQALSEHPAVAESAVVGVPSERTEEEVHAIVVLAPGSGPDVGSVTPEQLIEFLEPRVARFMIPRYWTFVDELPKTPTLRVRKAELRTTGITESTWDRRAVTPNPPTPPGGSP